MGNGSTPQALHDSLVRAGGDPDRLSDPDLAEIGVTREHVESYAAFLASLAAAVEAPLAASGDDLSSFAYWRERYAERMADGDLSY